MDDFNRILENNTKDTREAKKFSLEMKASSLQQLILQRFQALTIISSIGFAIAGIIISFRSELIKNEGLVFLSGGLFIVIAIISLGRHLFLIRSDIKAIAKKIENLTNGGLDDSIKEKEFKADWWPEVLYVLLVIGVVLFGLSFLI